MSEPLFTPAAAPAIATTTHADGTVGFTVQTGTNSAEEDLIALGLLDPPAGWIPPSARSFTSQRTDSTGRVIRFQTEEDRRRMADHKKKFRRDGTPRVSTKDPVRTFRAPDAIWDLVSKHATEPDGGRSAWLRRAIERYAAECDRQQAYAARKRGKSPAPRADGNAAPARRRPAKKG